MEIILLKSFTQKPWRSHSTYQLIERSLQEKWKVHSISTQNPSTLISFIRRLQWERNKKLFIFNIAEYLNEKNKEIFLPALIEEIGIPQLGSGSESVAIGLDKETTKKILFDNHIPTPQYFVAESQGQDSHLSNEKIDFPLIVKPLREGGHIGITADSIVFDNNSLNKQANRIFMNHNQPAIVEEFITGPGMREFSVGIIDGEKRLFLPIEIDYDAMDVESKILSFESAQNDRERTKPLMEPDIIETIIELADMTFKAVGARDFCRVDLRMDRTGCYVLEINLMPGLGPSSFLPQAARDIHGIEYSQLIQLLVENSMKRQIN